jgi:hypothetical protein
MTYLEVVFNYGAIPGENEMRAIDTMREVYGIRRVQFNAKQRTVRVEFDASRMQASMCGNPWRWRNTTRDQKQRQRTGVSAPHYPKHSGKSGWREKARGAHRKPLAEVIL